MPWALHLYCWLGLILMCFLPSFESYGNSKTCILDGGKTGFLCTSGVCVDSLFRCDGLAQCYDSSDERNCCDATAPIRGKYFLCGSGKCISTRLRCDEEIDCNTDQRKDSSDEEGCLHLSTVEISLIIMFIILLLALLVYKVILKRQSRCLKKPIRMPTPPDFLTSARNTTVHHESSYVGEVEDSHCSITQPTACSQSHVPILDSIQINAPPAYHIAVSGSYPRTSNILSAVNHSQFTTGGIHFLTPRGFDSPPPSYEDVKNSSSQYKIVRTEGLAVSSSSIMQIPQYRFESQSNTCCGNGSHHDDASLPAPYS